LPQYFIDLTKADFPVISKFDIKNSITTTPWFRGLRSLKGKALDNAVNDHFKYAILSHRHGDDEPDFATIQEQQGVDRAFRLPAYSSQAGYKKLEGFCTEAKRLGYTYAWADTCCLDMKSSADLQEAINSMFSWYRGSDICLVYLATATDLTRTQLAKDDWFRRGWTLLELLAPKRISFYDTRWGRLRKTHLSRNDKGSDMQPVLESITGIRKVVFEDFNPSVTKLRLVEMMSWASRRQTERPEDMAYSLLGIFDVNMTINYGEGDRAFYRLQKQIMKRNSDWTLFLWGGKPSSVNNMLAYHPSGFDYTRSAQMTSLLRDLSVYTAPGSVDNVDYQATWVSHGRYAHIKSTFGGSEMPRSLTPYGLFTKFSLYPIEYGQLVGFVPGDDAYYEYRLKAETLHETTAKLIPDDSTVHPVQFTRQTDFIAIVNGYNNCLALLINVPSMTGGDLFGKKTVKIPTVEPIIVRRPTFDRNAESIYIY
jgi:hypothetical protein